MSEAANRFEDNFNKAVKEAFGDSLAGLMYDLAPKKHKFPQGFKWRYFKTRKVARFRQWYCVWTTTVNENGKYLSFIYEWRGKRASAIKEREHKRRNAAKARARKLFDQRTAATS